MVDCEGGWGGYAMYQGETYPRGPKNRSEACPDYVFLHNGRVRIDFGDVFPDFKNPR